MLGLIIYFFQSSGALSVVLIAHVTINSFRDLYHRGPKIKLGVMAQLKEFLCDPGFVWGTKYRSLGTILSIGWVFRGHIWWCDFAKMDLPKI